MKLARLRRCWLFYGQRAINDEHRSCYFLTSDKRKNALPSERKKFLAVSRSHEFLGNFVYILCTTGWSTYIVDRLLFSFYFWAKETREKMIVLVNNLYFSHDFLLRYVDSELSQLHGCERHRQERSVSPSIWRKCYNLLLVNIGQYVFP